MKKLIIVANLIFIAATTSAQQPQTFFSSNPFPKTIKVSGSADMEIIPDEIYVNVELKEYQKKGEDKKDIETIKSQFLESCKTVGIPDSTISIFSYTGYNPYFWKKRKNDPNLYTSITYQVKFKSSEMMDKLVEKLDDDATQNFLIVSISHSKINEFRRQLKIAAVKAAKDKGLYLTEAIGERLGESISIEEPAEPGINVSNSGYYDNIRIRGMNSLTSNYSYKLDGLNDGKSPFLQQVDFKKLKLRFEVEVLFAIK